MGCSSSGVCFGEIETSGVSAVGATANVYKTTTTQDEGISQYNFAQSPQGAFSRLLLLSVQFTQVYGTARAAARRRLILEGSYVVSESGPVQF